MDKDIFFVEGAELRSLKEHPLCVFVPASAGVSAARNRKIVMPVVLIGSDIVDGRARVREAVRLGLTCPCRLFNPEFDGHPATFIAEMAREQRKLTTPQRAVLAASLVHQIMQRPQWLERYDNGLTNQLRTQRGREPFLQACGISSRTYQRVQGIFDADLLQAISDERVSLRDAHAARDLGAVKRRRIFALPHAEQTAAFERAISRAKKRVPKTRPLDLPRTEAIMKFVRRMRTDFYQGSWASAIKIKGDSDE
ncbi:hypothetical protein [Paraburkholderia humisilvae]|uniref:hypothetical protein n=1 Tax=Paraburkholderia humisilvae TaxID=627669 RepID=UPI001582D584|nr:hypothetical protein [Paraburkholderia humisilvae]